MKKILLLLSTLYGTLCYSQEIDKMLLPPCGTPPQYQQTSFKDIDFQRSIDDTILYVPITIHQMSNDNGSHFSTMRLLDAFNRLNADYQSSNIHWFMEGNIRFVKNTFWNNHKTIPEGWDMMSKNNIKNTLNCYVCTDAAGNCGYNTPYGGVALSRSCMGPGDHTWAHELGHALSLPHPFLGWEAKTYNPNVPTPTKVTYDYTQFKDSLILNQTIIDTAFVELLDKSNCAIAADKICDTKPDYISTRWACDANKESPNTYKDPKGASFKVDATLYMSYSLDACQNRFSTDEINIMRGILRGKKKNLLYNQTPKNPLPNEATTLLLPAEKSTVPADNILFQWDKVPNAELYVVEISRVSSLNLIDFEYITDKTEVVIDKLVPEKTYYWRARAFNSHYGGLTSTKGSFFTSSLTSTKTITEIENSILYPNPNKESKVTLQLNLNKDLKTQIQLFDFTGKIVYMQNAQLNLGTQQINIPTETLPKGIYLVVISDEKGGMLTKTMIRE